MAMYELTDDDRSQIAEAVESFNLAVASGEVDRAQEVKGLQDQIAYGGMATGVLQEIVRLLTA